MQLELKESKEEIIKKSENSFLSFFLKNTRITYLIIIGLLIGGIVSLVTIQKEDAPEIDYGMVIINTFYEGASAVDMDLLVTQEIENKIKNINGISKINSSSRNSFSSIVIEFKPNTNMIKAIGELRSKIDEAKSKIPEDAKEPKIEEINSNQPLFSLHISGEVHSALLRSYAEKLKTFIERISYVQDVNINGGGEKTIYIDLSPTSLKEYNLTPLQVISAIKLSNSDNPIGSITINNLNYDLRIQGKYKNINDIKNVVVKSLKSNKGNSIIKVEDLGKVYENIKDEEVFESLTLNTCDNGNRSANCIKQLNTISLSIKKIKGTDIFTVDPYIKSEVEKFRKENFGDEVRIDYLNQRMEMVKQSYKTVAKSLFEALIIVIIVLTIFLGFKEALVSSLIIPLTFGSTILCLKLLTTDSTLNFMTNFSMILALGILVDNAIVIVQGSNFYINKGFTPYEAILASVHDFKNPLISSMFTTLAVFIPLVSLPGILGKYLSFIPITVSIALVISLIIALTLIPTVVLNRFSFLDKIQSKFNRFRSWFDGIQRNLELQYKDFIYKNLKNRKYRIGVIYGVIILFTLSTFIPNKFTMFPGDDFDFLMINIEMPSGTHFSKTEIASKKIENEIMTYKEVKYISSDIKEDKSKIFVELYKKKERKEKGLMTNSKLSTILKDKFSKIKEYEISVAEPKRGPPGGAPVAFRIILDDANKLNNIHSVVKDMKSILEKIPGTYSIKDDIINTPGEIRYTIDREQAISLGVSPESIATILRSAVSGVESSKIIKGSIETKIIIRYAKDKLKDFGDIDNIQIPNNFGGTISLSQIVKKEMVPGFVDIKRANNEIAITVSSDLTKEGNALEISNKFKEKIKNYKFPNGVSIKDAGENMENKEIFVSLLIGFVTALFLIFVILVIQFDSYINPFIIMFTIIMAQTGVNIGLFVTNTERSFAFIIGVIALAGIVVNNGIILIDRINNLKKDHPHMPPEDIIAISCETRLQPIILTKLITITGILPLLWVDNFWAGLSITIVSGLFIASFLTLFVTPAMYYQLNTELKITMLPIGILITGLISLTMLLKLNFFGIIPLLICILLIWKLKKLKHTW